MQYSYFKLFYYKKLINIFGILLFFLFEQLAIQFYLCRENLNKNIMQEKILKPVSTLMFSAIFQVVRIVLNLSSSKK